MPIGVLVNSASILTGGLLGLLFKKIIPNKLKENLIIYFSMGAFAIGIINVIKLNHLSIVILSLIIGSIIGELLNIDGKLKRIINNLIAKFAKDENESNNDKKLNIAMLIAIFCFSGTGLFGVMHEGITGDNSVLLAKSVLDFFTAAIFATTTGFLVSLIALPQLILFIALFYLSRLFGPYLIDNTISNFIALGGIITIMIGFNMAKIRKINVLNAIPSFFIVILLSQIFL